MKNLILTLIFSSFIYADSIKVAVAANVSYTIKPLIKEFNKTNNTKIRIILGSSGKLTAQIKNGAPYDLFLSADMKYPNALYKNKLTANKPKIYARGSLSIFSLKKRNLQDISIVNRVKKIAIANPKTSPYGKAAYEAISNAKLLDKNIKKFVYAENIAQTVQYAMSATDIGFIATSSLYSPKMRDYKQIGNFILVNSSLYTPIEQGVALLNNNKSSKAFYDFLFSQEAKKIFNEYGYNVFE